jgi:hypothetical protein
MNKNTNCTTTSFPRPTQPIASTAHGHSTRLRREMRIIGQRVQEGGEEGGGGCSTALTWQPTPRSPRA